ncbi:MAG: ComEC/Rec2 family competence protein [Cyclobacteriaceae bacterium]|jgi:competence protein ComEC
MFRWIPYAMVRIAAFFVAGILLGIYQPHLNVTTRVVLALALTLLFFFLALRFPRQRIVIGTAGLLAVAAFGYLHVYNSSHSNQPAHLLAGADSVRAYKAVVVGGPQERNKSIKYKVEVIQVLKGAWQNAHGRVNLYISRKDTARLQYGDRILLKGRPTELMPPQNPGEFDFKRYLSFQNIYHQHFVRPGEWQLLEQRSRQGLLYYAHVARAWCTDILRLHVSGEREQAIAVALVLGVTDGIDTDLQHAYAASGAMHVLAVSGLHVGILYGIILLLMKPLERFAGSRWWVALVSLILLWGFAFVTGLSPSVLRAVTMFSFVAVARPFGRATNIYNTLAASAFVLLLYDPFMIMSVGFQLSYLAVLGIVYLQKPLYDLWEIENPVLDWVWKISCISLAAQLATFALGMLYFHQFPLYFLFSNLFVIPLSTAILIGGVGLLLVSWLSPVASAVGWLVQVLVQILNTAVVWVEQLPVSLIQNIHLTTFQCWLIIGLLLAIIFFVEFRSLRWMYGAALIASVLAVTQWIHAQTEVSVRVLTVYRVGGFSALEWIDHGKSAFWGDSALAADDDRMRFHIQPNRLRHGVAQASTQYWQEGQSALLALGQRRILLLGNSKWQGEIDSVDVVVVRDRSIRSLKELDEKVRYQRLVLDGTNPEWYISRLLEEDSLGRVHAVTRQGAFQLFD